MLRRFWNYIKALLSGGMDKIEDPEILLAQAQREMGEMHARNRERAVQAITAKNNLQNAVDDLRKKVTQLQAKAELALKRGERELALQILKEKGQYETSLTTTEATLQGATETVEQIKVNIRREEERIRQKTAEALALKAQWKSSQIQNEMSKALDSLQSNFEDTEQAFGRAQSKIRNATSEASARAELQKQRVGAQIEDLDAAESDVNAENELAQLEAKLGLGSAPVNTTTTVSSPSSDVERELAELEAKIGSGGGKSGS